MTYVYIAAVIGVVGLIALAVFALHLFKVVRRFGQEVARVSEQLGSATSKLEQAAATAPGIQKAGIQKAGTQKRAEPES